MSRPKLRVPGRYERPAEMRPALGDRATEAGIRAGWHEANRRNAAALRIAPQPLNRRRRQVATVESATTLERVEILEATRGAAKPTGKPAEMTIDIIRSGWNKARSRYYPSDVLERDVPAVYPAGTHMYIDHPTATQRDDQPERSLQTLAAVFTSTPYPVQEADGRVIMRVEARVYSRWQGFLSEAKDDIGVSINGNGDGHYGTAEGNDGMILEQLTHGQSVDFVTKPGAGGRIVALLESDRQVTTVEAGSLGAYLEAQIHSGFTVLADGMYGDGRLTRPERIAASNAVGDALAAFVKGIEAKAPDLYKRDRWSVPADADTATREALTVEATAEQTRDAIDRALQVAYAGERRYAWVQDYDPDAGVVWFRAGGDDLPGCIWQQAYTGSATSSVALVGDRVEVKARTVYEPVTGPGPGDQVATQEALSATQTPTSGAVPRAGSPTATEAATTAKEQPMTDTTVKDAATREADEAAARVRTAESLELARYRVADTARGLVDAKLLESELPAAAQNRVRAQFPATSLPLVEADKSLDTRQFTTTLEAAITAERAYVAELLEANGVGRVAGAGAGAGAGTGIPTAFGAAAAKVNTRDTDTATVEALVTEYTNRGMSPAAAAAAARGRN